MTPEDDDWLAPYAPKPKAPAKGPTLLDQFRESLGAQESGDNFNVNPNTRTRATGKYQVLPGNIGPWTQKYLGKTLTPQQFQSDPDAQIRVFNGEMGKYLNLAAQQSPDDEDAQIRRAAAMWYGGEGAANKYDNPRRFRPKEPSFREYTNIALNALRSRYPKTTAPGVSTPEVDDTDWLAGYVPKQPSEPAPPISDAARRHYESTGQGDIVKQYEAGNGDWLDQFQPPATPANNGLSRAQELARRRGETVEERQTENGPMYRFTGRGGNGQMLTDAAGVEQELAAAPAANLPQPVTTRPTAPRDLRQTVRRMVPRTPHPGGNFMERAGQVMRRYERPAVTMADLSQNLDATQSAESNYTRIAQEEGGRIGPGLAPLQDRISQRMAQQGYRGVPTNAQMRRVVQENMRPSRSDTQGYSAPNDAPLPGSSVFDREAQGELRKTFAPAERVGNQALTGLQNANAGFNEWLSNLTSAGGIAPNVLSRTLDDLAKEGQRDARERVDIYGKPTTMDEIFQGVGGTPVVLAQYALTRRAIAGAFGEAAATPQAVMTVNSVIGNAKKPVRDQVLDAMFSYAGGRVFGGAEGMGRVGQTATLGGYGAGEGVVRSVLDDALNGRPIDFDRAKQSAVSSGVQLGGLGLAFGGKPEAEARPGERVTEAPRPVENLTPESAPRVPEVVQDLPPNLRDNAERKAPVLRTAPLPDRQVVRESVTEPPVEAARPKETAPVAQFRTKGIQTPAKLSDNAEIDQYVGQQIQAHRKILDSTFPGGAVEPIPKGQDYNFLTIKSAEGTKWESALDTFPSLLRAEKDGTRVEVDRRTDGQGEHYRVRIGEGQLKNDIGAFETLPEAIRAAEAALKNPPKVETLRSMTVHDAEGERTVFKGNGQTFTTETKPSAPVATPEPAPERVTPVELAKLPPREQQNVVADHIDRLMRRRAMDDAGQGVLDDIIEAGLSPERISSEFWDKTYWQLPGDAQKRFQNYLGKIHGQKPGDVIAVDKDGKQIIAKDWFDIAANSDLGHEAEYLEGIDRGYVVLMHEANEALKNTGRDSVKPSAQLSAPVESSKVAEVIQRPVDEARAVAPERVGVREPKVVKPPREVVRESAKESPAVRAQTEYLRRDTYETAIDAVPMKGKRGSIQVATKEGKDAVPPRSGTIYGDWGVFKDPEVKWTPYNVTHMPSGLRGGYFKTMKEANRFVQAIRHSEVDTSSPDLANNKEVLQTLADIYRYQVQGGEPPAYFAPTKATATPVEAKVAVPASEGEGAERKAGDTATKEPEGPDFEDQITERHAGFPFLNRLFSLPRARQDTVGKGSAVVDPNSTAEARMEAAKGIKQPGWAQRGKDAILNVTHAMRRTFPDLDPKKDQVHAVATDLFRQLEAAPAFAKATAADKIAHITANLGPERTKLLERASILPDIMKDVETGLYDGKDLPFGFKDKADLQKSLDHYNDLVDNTPAVKDALARRRTFVKSLTKELVDLNLLPKDALKDDRYFHRQVMAYVNDPAFVGTGARDARMSQKGFQRGRTGGGDFNTRYVEAEFEWVSQALEQISRKTVLDRMNQAANLQPDLVRQAEMLSKQTGKEVDWHDLIPEGYRIWQPKKGNFFYPATSITERTLDNLLTSGRALEMDDVKEILALGGKRPEWVVPEGIAKTLDTFGQKVDEGAFGSASAQIMGMWKQWVLLSPPRATKYMLNNLSGDLDVTVAYDPKIATYAPKAARDLYQYHVKGKGMSPDVAEAMKDGVIGSGLTVSEIPDINKVGAFQLLTTDKPNLLMRGVERYWHGVKTFNDWRENTLRLSAYRYFINKLGKGEKVYGASSKKQIDMLRSAGMPDREIAAKLARELIGDYGGVSHGGQYIRRHLVPFYSWVEVNAPRYARLLRNAPFEDSGGAGRKARTVGVAAGRSAWKLGKLAGKANLLLLLAAAWNRSMYPDEEEEMRKTDQGRIGHIILGKRPDGSIRTMRVQGALSDALDWFGAEDYPSDAEDVLTGKATWQDKAADAVKAPVEKVVGGLHPGFKSPFELIAGESTYPHIFGKGTDFGFRTTQIRDRKEYVARLFSLDGLYRRITGRPKPPTDPSTMGTLADWTFAYRTDPGEAAYWNARSNAFEYGRKAGKGSGAGEPTERGNALYYYKQAVKWGDKEAAARYLKEYFTLGGSEKGMEQSIRMGHPLGSIAKKNQQEYIDSLSKDQKDELAAAIKFYEGTYGTRQERGQQRKVRRDGQPSATAP